MSTTELQKDLLQQIENRLLNLDLPARPETLYQPFKYAIEVGGKRIRPLLTLLAAGMCEGDVEDAMPAAIAVEILHNFTLVHDDIMDSADTRRGEPSVFKKWDENVAILSGDVMFAGAMSELAFYGHQDKYSKQDFSLMYDRFLKAVTTVCEGQALDMEFVDRADVSLDEYIEMISGKTAALLSASLEMGGIAAQAGSEYLNHLSQLGLEMGVAFQIQDDLLDAIADPEKFGKRPGGDIFEGKKTYLTILALERANEEQKALITSTLLDKDTTEESVVSVLQIMKELNVINDVAAYIENRYKACDALIAKFPDSEYKKELQNLLIFLQNRDH